MGFILCQMYNDFADLLLLNGPTKKMFKNIPATPDVKIPSMLNYDAKLVSNIEM